MKILVFTQYFWPENFRINDLTVGLAQKGHSVTVVTGIPNYPEGKYYSGYGLLKNWLQEYKGVKVLRLPMIPRGRGGNLCLFLNYISFMISALIFPPFLCRGKIDLVFFSLSPVAEGIPAIVLKFFKRASLVFWVQDLWPESLSAIGAVKSKNILKAVEKLVYFIYSKCDRILIQSDGFLNPIKNLGIDYKRITYYPNSVDKIYQPVVLEETAQEHAELPVGFRVMFGGNIGAAQDFETLLAAAEILKGYQDICWVVIGDGRLRPSVELRIKELGLTKSVYLLGKRPFEAMPRYFSLADVLLVNLKNESIFRLTIPSKIQAYLACAKPIIAALDGEGARIIKEAGAGLICMTENPDALANTVLEMYNKSQYERKKMGENGRNYFNAHFESEMLLDRLEILMGELIKKKKMEYVYD